MIMYLKAWKPTQINFQLLGIPTEVNLRNFTVAFAAEDLTLFFRNGHIVLHYFGKG